MITLSLESPATYRRMLGMYGGDMGEAFALAVQKILVRHFAQNGEPLPSESAFLAFARSFWELAKGHGLPAPLQGPDQGASVELSDAEADRIAAPLVSAFPIAGSRPALANAARELLRGIISPEFKKCRQSFKETAPGAANCERQKLEVARARPSGSHCADCPYWIQLNAEKNEKLLLKEWDASRTVEFAENIAIFLPSDFRSLRQLLHLHARFGPRS